MKKIGLILLLVFSFLLLTNCNKDKKEDEKINEKINFSDESYKLFEKFANKKKEIMEKLKTLNKEEANSLYEEYVFENNAILGEIDEATAKFLDSIYYGPEGTEFTEKDWNNANKILNKYDLELWDIGEGMVTIRELPHLYYDVFKNYVTDDYREYLKIWAKDDEELYQADAGLVISFEELGERIIRWENFLKKYPNSTLNPRVMALLNSYRADYLLGMDNTPTRDGGYDGKPFTIYEESEKEFNRFMKKYPNSPTVELIKYFLKNYQNDNIYDLIQDKIIEKFEKDPFTDVLSESLGKMVVIQGNYLKYILGEKDWSVNIQEGYIYSGEEKYPIQILGTSTLNENGSSTWTWAWKNSDTFGANLLTLAYNVHSLGSDLKLRTFVNPELEITDEVNGNVLSTIACGISGVNLAYDKIAYTGAGGIVYYAIKDLPDKVFSSSVDAGLFMDITLNSIKLYDLNHKLFIESFLKQNKTKYKWQGETIIADFGEEGELKIDFEKVEDKFRLKEINFNEVK